MARKYDQQSSTILLVLKVAGIKILTEEVKHKKRLFTGRTHTCVCWKDQEFESNIGLT